MNETKQMNAIKLDVAYDLKYPEGSEAPANINKAYAELSRDYIEYAVTSHYKEGLSSQWRRVYAKIQNKIADAIKSESNFTIELSDVELSFIKMSFGSEKTKFGATLARYVVVLEDEIFGSSNK